MMDPSARQQSGLQHLSDFIAEWCWKVFQTSGSGDSDSDDDNTSLYGCIICKRQVKKEDPSMTTKAEYDDFVKTVITCIVPQDVDRTGSRHDVTKSRTERVPEQQLTCCSSCFSQTIHLFELFSQLETLRLQFNKLRDEVGSSWVQSCSRFHQNKTRSRRKDPKEVHEDVCAWRESIKKQEHIYPSLVKTHYGRSSAGGVASSSDLNQNRLQHLDKSYASIHIKEEIEDGESSSYSYNGLEDFIVKPDLDLFPQLNLPANALSDIKITKLIPTVRLYRLPEAASKCKVEINQLESKYSCPEWNTTETRAKRFKERNSRSQTKEVEVYIPPFDWNLEELPSRKNRAVNLLGHFSSPDAKKASMNSTLADFTFTKKVSLNAKLDYNLDDFPSRKRIAAEIVTRSTDSVLQQDEETGFVPETTDAFCDDSMADGFPSDASSADNETIKKADTNIKQTDIIFSPNKKRVLRSERFGGGTRKLGKRVANAGKCKICKETFVSRIELQNHIHTKHKDFRFKCSACPRRFINSHTLAIHSLVHVSFSRVHKCSHCDGQFTSKRSILSHQVKVHSIFDSTGAHKCTKCLRHFDSLIALRSHDNVSHTSRNDYLNIRCRVCEFKPRFETYDALRAHEESEAHLNFILSRRNIHCSLCAIKFTSLDELKAHKDSPEHKIEKQKLVEIDLNTYCKVCRVQCESKEALAVHRKTDQHQENHSKLKLELSVDYRSRKGPFPCPKCGKVLSSKYVAIQHMHMMHSQESYKCEICGKSFSRRSDFNSHKRSHGEAKSIQCDICGKGFISRRTFEQHMKAHTSTPQTYICENCGKSYASLNSLKNHTLLVHPPSGQTGQHRCKCKYCPENFHSPYKVRAHMIASHKDEYLQGETHVCTVCWHKFATNDLLQEHMGIHDGLKCSFCGKICKMRGHLIKHLRSHTGEKPFPCTICGKAFTDASNLKEHTYRHTGERPYKCEICGEGFLRKGEMMKHQEQDHDVHND